MFEIEAIAAQRAGTKQMLLIASQISTFAVPDIPMKVVGRSCSQASAEFATTADH
jgi:hypothetical protein